MLDFQYVLVLFNPLLSIKENECQKLFFARWAKVAPGWAKVSPVYGTKNSQASGPSNPRALRADVASKIQSSNFKLSPA